MGKKQSDLQIEVVKANLTRKEKADLHLRMKQELVSAEATYVRRLILIDIQENL